MRKNLKIADVKCVDESSRARGITLLCTDEKGRGRASYVTLIFGKSTPHKKTDELVRQLWDDMKVSDVILDMPD